jgi:sigma-B regulation protein RsbU (phosphoserine phosphatase)
MLPPGELRLPGWWAAYHYEGLGPVSGDDCDLVPAGTNGFFFFVGDVTGKGIAASILIAHLHATFRAFVTMDLPLPQIVARASRSLCEHTLPSHFATLACGRADDGGTVCLCNAGHVPPLLVRRGRPTALPATGLPLGVFCDAEFAEHRLELQAGDALLLYSDGLVEALDTAGREYGTDRLNRLAGALHGLPPPEFLVACRKDWLSHRAGAPKTDDLSLMVIRRTD